MSEKIRLVRNDTGPQIRLTLTDDSTGNAIDLTGATVTLHFRAVGSTTVLVSRPLTVPSESAASGIAVLIWAEGDLDQPAGDYEGEIEIVWPALSIRQTIFTPLKFKLREDFA